MVTNAHDEYLNTPLGVCKRCNGEGYATHPDDLWMYDMMAYADYPDPSPPACSHCNGWGKEYPDSYD